MYGDAWHEAEIKSRRSVHLGLGYTTRHHQRPFSSLDAYHRGDSDAPKRPRCAHADIR